MILIEYEVTFGLWGRPFPLSRLFQIDEVFFTKGEEGPDDDVQGDGRSALGSAHFLPAPTFSRCPTPTTL